MWSALSFSRESVFLQVYGALACRTKENVVELFSIYGVTYNCESAFHKVVLEIIWVNSSTRIPTDSWKPWDPSPSDTLFLLSYVLKISHLPKQLHCFLTHRSTLSPWLTNRRGCVFGAPHAKGSDSLVFSSFSSLRSSSLGHPDTRDSGKSHRASGRVLGHFLQCILILRPSGHSCELPAMKFCLFYFYLRQVDYKL